MLFAMLLGFGSAALACDEKGAFGFEFGLPVPKEAEKTVGGGSVKNAVVQFAGSVPAPEAGFTRYLFGANKDRKFVYSVEAERPFYEGGNMDIDRNPEYAAALDQVRKDILVIKKDWEARYGLVYKPDYENGLSWTAESATHGSRIYTSGGRLLVECYNQALQSKALKIAFESW